MFSFSCLRRSSRSTLRCTALMLVLGLQVPLHAQTTDCNSGASDACLRTFSPAGSSLQMHYYASLPIGPSQGDAPSNALIVMHGHSRDANKTFDAGLATSKAAGALARTLVIAPLYQVSPGASRKCLTAGVPAAGPNDLVWTCTSWPEGAVAENDAHVSSYSAMDSLIAEVKKNWPSVKTITLGGFSAGGQVVQHYIGLAAKAPEGTSIRYVVADPGSWLYLDSVRPALTSQFEECANGAGASRACVTSYQVPPQSTSCQDYDRWKYGLQGAPGVSADEVRAKYLAANVSYLEGQEDNGPGPGKAYRLLDRTCAAQLQGQSRLERGIAYFGYLTTHLTAQHKPTLAVVPGCAHNVACVFPSEAGQAALFGP